MPPTVPTGDPTRVDVAVAGYGEVGRAFHRAVGNRRAALRQAGLDLRVTTLLRSDRVLRDPDGLPPDPPDAWVGRDGADLPPDLEADVLVEATPTDLAGGQPGLGHVRAALDRGLDVATANKAPVALAYEEIMSRARQADASVRFGATVAASTPALAALRRGLAGDRIRRIEGVLNGTTTFVLTRMGAGASLQEALDEARRLGYAEADPSADVSGRDAAAKAVILANALLEGPASLDGAEVRGLEGLDPGYVQAAADEGTPVRLVADVLPGGKVEVAPRRVEADGPLAVEGVRNALRVTADMAGTLRLSGPGAGGRATAAALLSDVVTLARPQGVQPGLALGTP